MDIIRIQQFETDGKLVKLIAKARDMPPETVARMLRYNVLRPQQFADLCGVTIAQVHNWMRAGKRKGKEVPGKLTQVGIFARWERNKNNGQYEETPGDIFILRNAISEGVLLQASDPTKKFIVL